ncbi:MAG: prepilin-type N-terminal cleavage/methylation domain-containing protein [Armatimonadota bacterium]
MVSSRGSRGRCTVRRGAFTLVEMLVTIVIVAVAVVAVFRTIASLTETDIRARDADLLQRLACQKMSEMGVVTDPRTAENSGDFADQGYEAVTWTVEVEPSGTLNVEQVTITAQRDEASQQITGLIFQRPLASAGSTGSAGGG